MKTSNIIAKLSYELKKLIDNRDINGIRKLVDENNDVDIADATKEFTLFEVLFLFRSLKTSTSSEIFICLNDEQKKAIIESLTNDELQEAISSIRSSEVVEIIEGLPEALISKIFNVCDPKTLQNIKQFMKFPKESVGSYCNIKFISLDLKDKVKEAILKVKNEPEICHSLNYYYVTNKDNALVGVVSLKDIFFASRQELIKDIMDVNPLYVNSNDDREVVSNMFQKYEIEELPVVNDKHELIGIINYEDVWEIMEEEVTEDFEKSAGITPITDKEYLQVKPITMARSRVKWLILLMISATLSQIVLQIFSSMASSGVLGTASFLGNTIYTAILVPILPVISGTAGNAGCQSSTVVLRALALGEITPKEYWKVALKEYKTSFFVGVLLVVSNFVRMLIYYYIISINHHPMPGHQFIGLDNEAWKSIFATSASLLVIVSIVKFVGASLPFLAYKLKQDPAIMAAPLLTTLTDAISTTIFFLMSMLFFTVLAGW